MSVLSEIPNRGHERVTVVQDSKTGLLAIIAVHNTAIGPSLGGCRINAYSSLDEALTDVLKLSEAMSYKNALCGISFGGGKSVIIADRNMSEGRDALFQSFGRSVQALGGCYITAEDMGTTVNDMESISTECEYVAGKDPAKGGGGDPSPYTALGVFSGIKACLERVYGTADFSTRKVAIQGVGSVGKKLLSFLLEAGSQVVISDTREDALNEFSDIDSVNILSPEEIVSAECDVFSPCAIGGTVNESNVSSLRCKIIAGGANNQLADNQTERLLNAKGILYAPDFAINAGGVILCADEFEPGGFTESRVEERAKRIQQTIAGILDKADSSGLLAGEVALKMAQDKIQAATERA